MVSRAIIDDVFLLIVLSGPKLQALGI